MELDRKINEIFPGKVVRKDLVRRVKAGANIPIYVLEYLLGKYCATDDPTAIEAGLILVDMAISQKVIRPDESNKIKALLKEKGEYGLIDKVKVRLVASEDKYWAELVNFNESRVHIPTHFVRKYERLLEGGIWCEVDLQYMFDEEKQMRRSPFWIQNLKPIQLASFEFEEYQNSREKFSTEEWIDLLITSIGLEPSAFNWRQKLLLLVRLVPMVESNYNLIELGPRGTGKSFVYREISPYSILISGGKTTVPNLFYNMNTRQVGLVGLWDVVAFDEVGGMDMRERDLIDILKDYMESGSFGRGREEITAKASMCFLGNINQPIDVLIKTSHLFQPLPEKMIDPALIDRIHFYLPGWELPKMSKELFTSRYGFVVDYLAEALREARKQNFTAKIDAYFSLGDHLNARDAKAVRKTVSGLVKLIHPDGNVKKEEIKEYLQIALEGRRRVKEQLKKILPFEYAHTSFSYTDNETREEFFVGVPEEGGRDLI
jgi:ATP-dependent Lon protease